MRTKHCGSQIKNLLKDFQLICCRVAVKMYCTNCGIKLDEKWVYCPDCGTQKATIAQKKEGTMTFPEFISKFAKERDITEKEARELAIKVLIR